MSLEKTVFKNVTWLAAFKFTSQAFSWFVTIIVARILLPEDYGLSAMATIITGYAELFSEMGLGSAIIQKKELGSKEISSVFWFGLLLSSIFAIMCFPISYATASIFNDPRVIPLTQSIAVIFLLSGVQIVPMNMLRRDMSFKEIGKIEMATTMSSGGIMIVMALLGFGVWTLIGGRIARAFFRTALLYWKVKWTPKFYFRFVEAYSYIKFGIFISVGNTFFYLQEKSDRFFAGRAWNASLLGFYTFALQLAQLPTEKIVNLVNQVSYPAFAKLQDRPKEFRAMYLKITKVVFILVGPIFLGGFLIGDYIIKIFLNDKWYFIIELFKFLCISQIFMAMNSINNFVHAAKGNPHIATIYNGINAIIMSVSFFIAVQYDFVMIIVPWMTSFIIMVFAWIIYTLHSLNIRLSVYFKNLMFPIIAMGAMGLPIFLFKYKIDSIFPNLLFIKTIISITFAGITYFAILYTFDKKFVLNMVSMFRKN